MWLIWRSHLLSRQRFYEPRRSKNPKPFCEPRRSKNPKPQMPPAASAQTERRNIYKPHIESRESKERETTQSTKTLAQNNLRLTNNVEARARKAPKPKEAPKPNVLKKSNCHAIRSLVQRQVHAIHSPDRGTLTKFSRTDPRQNLTRPFHVFEFRRS